MALATMADADVLPGTEVAMPSRGPWTARVRLATETVPTGAQVLAFDGGLSLSGTVRSAALDGRGAVWALVVGGADGLRSRVAQAFRGGFVRDVLGAITRASGETQATDIDATLLALSWPHYTVSGRCSTGLDVLAAACARSTGTATLWRVRADGALWIGAEAWPEVQLGEGDAILDQRPDVGTHLLAVEVATIEPGQDVAGLGRVAAVTHRIYERGVRTFAHVEP